MDPNHWGYGQAYAGRVGRVSPPPAHADLSRIDLSLLDPASLNPGAYAGTPTHPAFGTRSFGTLPQMNYGLSTYNASIPQLLDPMSTMPGFAYQTYKAMPQSSFPGMEHALEHMLPQAKYPAVSMPFTAPTSRSEFMQSGREHSGLVMQDVHPSMMESSKGWGLSNFLPTQSGPFGNLQTDISGIPDLYMASLTSGQRGQTDRLRVQKEDSAMTQRSLPEASSRAASRGSSASYHSMVDLERLTPAHYSEHTLHHSEHALHKQKHVYPQMNYLTAEMQRLVEPRHHTPKSSYVTSPQSEEGSTRQQSELHAPSKHHIPDNQPSPTKQRKLSMPAQYHKDKMRPYSDVGPGHVNIYSDIQSNKEAMKKSVVQQSVSSPPQDLSLKHQQSSQQQQHYLSHTPHGTQSLPVKARQQTTQFFNLLTEPSLYPHKAAHETSESFGDMQLSTVMKYDPISPVSDTQQTESYSTVNIQDLSSTGVRAQSVDTHNASHPHVHPNTAMHQHLAAENTQSAKVIEDLSNSYAVQHQRNKIPHSFSQSHAVSNLQPAIPLSLLPQHGSLISAPSDLQVVEPPTIQAVADSTTKTKKRARKKKMTAAERQEAQIKALFDDDGYKPNLMTDEFLDQIQQQTPLPLPAVAAVEVDKKKIKRKKKKVPTATLR